MIYVLYFFSGIAALATEVIWARRLHRLLGSESWAVALVLSAFLAGMGLGALLAQAQLPRLRNTLRAFAIVEFAAAVCTLGFSFALEAGAGLFRGWGGELVAAGSMVLVTAPLGAGLPILVSALARNGALERVNRRLRWLYGVNALGGAVGGASAGLLGVALLGEHAVLFLAAGLQALVAACAALLSRHPRYFPGAAGDTGVAKGEKSRSDRGLIDPRLLFVFLLLSGFVVFFWEVLWTRILVLTVGSSVYAFATVAASVVLGIGVGSIVFGGSLLRRHGAWVLPLGTALLTLGAYFAVPRLPEAYLLGVRTLGFSPLLCGALGAALVVFLPNLLLGSLFPWVISRRPRLAGSLYAVNSLGCVAGALCGGPLAAGHWPLELTFRFGLGALFALTACGVWLVRAELAAGRESRWEYGARVGLGAALLATLVAVLGSFEGTTPRPLREERLWGYKQLLSGVYHWGRDSLETTELETTYARRELLEVIEGREVIVSVELDRELNALYVLGNGRVEGGVPIDPGRKSRVDLPTQLLLGMMPALLTSGRRDSSCLLVGLGSGVTLGALLDSRLRLDVTGTVDVVELERAYLEAIQHRDVSRYIEPYLDVHDLPPLSRLRWHFGDARRVVARDLSARRYATIVSQPSEPWIAGAAPLFTVEFFREAAALLEEGGFFVQWVQLYRLDLESLQILVRTFHAVFPRVFVFLPPQTGELILVGSRAKIELERLLSGAGLRHLRAAGISEPLGFLAAYILGPAGIDRWVGVGADLPLNTDARGVLEFRAPRALYGDAGTAARNRAALRSLAARDPVSRYLPGQLLRPLFLRRLARANFKLGDLEEAGALLAGDRSPEAEALRVEIHEARTLGDTSGDARGDRRGDGGEGR